MQLCVCWTAAIYTAMMLLTVGVNDATSEALRDSSCSLTGTVNGCFLWPRTFTSPSWVLHSNFHSKLQSMTMWEIGCHTQTPTYVSAVCSSRRHLQTKEIIMTYGCQHKKVNGGIFYNSVWRSCSTVRRSSSHDTG